MARPDFIFAGSCGGCFWWRLAVPAFALRTIRPDLKIVLSPHLGFDQANVIVISRYFGDTVNEAIERWQKAGCKVVYELDDNVWELPDKNPARGKIRDKKLREQLMPYLPPRLAVELCGSNIKETEITLKKCDYVVTSTKPLSKIIKSKTDKPVFLYPNSIHLPLLALTLKTKKCVCPIPGVMDKPLNLTFPEIPPFLLENFIKERVDKFERFSGSDWIIWSSSAFHDDDVIEVKKAGLDIRGRIILFGGGKGQSEIASRVLSHYLPAQFYWGKILTLPYARGIAPLINHPFNISKSNIKVMEYLLAGMIPFASNVTPYKEFLEGGIALPLSEAEMRKKKFKKLKHIISNGINYINENYNAIETCRIFLKILKK